MDLHSIYSKFRHNLKYFRIEATDISARYRILVDQALRDLDCDEDNLDEDFLINISALRSRASEILHSGKWSDVADADKYLYSLATYLEVLANLKEYLICNPAAPAGTSQTCMENLVESFDMAILLGQPVMDEQGNNIFCSGASDLGRLLSAIGETEKKPPAAVAFPEIHPQGRTDIAQMNSLVEKTFASNFYAKGLPVIFQEGFNDWPALIKWRDLAYFQRNFGFRTVPIEVGSQYTTNDWGQELMLFKDFIAAQFVHPRPPGPIQYLAQHDLFSQIPELKGDIETPAQLKDINVDPQKIETKIWFGPGGTISPLHFDRKENFLCQVLGWKNVVLIGPEDSEFLYPYEGEMLSNTSQLDFSSAVINEEAFPLAKRAKRMNVLLGPGQMLYIPFGWWHFVTSLSPSISVSFWWNK